MDDTSLASRSSMPRGLCIGVKVKKKKEEEEKKHVSRPTNLLPNSV